MIKDEEARLNPLTSAPDDLVIAHKPIQCDINLQLGRVRLVRHSTGPGNLCGWSCIGTGPAVF